MAVVSVHDVSAYILQKAGPMSPMKLQKLLYYSQAWHLAWDDEPLFEEKIEAWAMGPVVYEVFDEHRGRWSVSEWPRGNGQVLDDNQRQTIDLVIESYGHLSGRQLSELTHGEDPWRDARGDLAPTARSNAEITPEALNAYYSAVDVARDATAVDELDWESWLADEPDSAADH